MFKRRTSDARRPEAQPVAAAGAVESLDEFVVVNERPVDRQPSINDVSPEARSRRAYISFELLSTEVTYVNGLKTLVDRFLRPLQDTGVLNKQEIRCIFSDVEVILNYNNILLEDLTKEMRHWSENTCLGKIFNSIVDFFVCYTEYINNYNSALEEVRRLNRTNKSFSNLVKRVEQEGLGGLDLIAFLILPIQRIPRYVLLLKDLCKATHALHPDLPDLQMASERVSVIAGLVNDRKRQAEAMSEVLRLDEQFVGGLECSLLSPSRRFVRFVDLQFPTSKGVIHSGRAFAFNDVLILARPNNSKGETFRVKHWIPLWTVELRPSPDSANDLIVDHQHHEYRLMFESPETCEFWKNLLVDLIKQLDVLVYGPVTDTNFVPDEILLRKIFNDEIRQNQRLSMAPRGVDLQALNEALDGIPR